LLPRFDSNEARWLHYKLGAAEVVGGGRNRTAEGLDSAAADRVGSPKDSFERCRSVRSVLPSRGWWHDEGVVAVALERPSGRHVKSVATLMRVQGAILACLPDELAVTEMVPAEWRKKCGLPGNATKDSVCLWAFKRWRNILIMDGDDSLPQDAYDAFCLAWALREMTSVEAAA
jgi:hypothetical protein